MSNHLRPWRRRDKKHLKHLKKKPRKGKKEIHLRDILEQLPPVE